MSSIELSKLRAHLRLLSNRLKLLQTKKTALAKQTRRTLAGVLEERKLESARIRIENLIQEDIYVELLEALEIYAELVLARCATLHGPEIGDTRLRESLIVLLYSAQHTDIKELHTLKGLVAHLTSKEFVQQAISDKEAVPEKILRKIHVEIPSEELVDLYLLEIAKAYNLSVPGVYEPPVETQPEPQPDAKSGEEKDEKKEAPPAGDDIWARFAALKK